jgi:hypothetical protein
MARVSFTLRRTAIDRGSYARYDVDTYNAAASAGNAASAGTWVVDDPAGTRDVDTSLRSDGYQLPPVDYVESFLEAFPVAYGVASIRWGAPLEAPGVSAVPTQTVLVYSPYGPVPTISSGTILSESSNEFSVLQNNLEGGQWAYYTLFIRYQSSGGDDYYEPVAYVEILMPENYGSTTLLWNRIPEYYRQQDIAIGEYVDPSSDFAITELGALPAGNVVGPLFKFLSVFGFEMDKTRTLIDYLMISRDPNASNVESLDAVASTVGLDLNSVIINASRVRSVLNDIGYLRRSKGTTAGILAYARALSNCDVELDETTREMTFYSQRVNYVTDPADATGLVTHRPAHAVEAQRLQYRMGDYDPSTYVAGDENTYPEAFGDEYAPGMYWTASASASSFEGFPVNVGDYIVVYEDSSGEVVFAVSGYNFDATNYSAYTTYTTSGNSYIPNGTGASAGITHVMFHLDSPIPVKQGDDVYFSVHSAIGTPAIKWGRLVDASGNIIGRSRGLTLAADAPAVQIPAASNVSTTDWTIAYVEFLVDLESVPSYLLELLLLERNHLGNYFDGNSRRGGWIVDQSGATVSDYRWSSEGDNNGNAYESISIYTEEYQRTRALLNSLFAEVLPITQSQYYSIVATDAIPGQSAIDSLTP